MRYCCDTLYRKLISATKIQDLFLVIAHSSDLKIELKILKPNEEANNSYAFQKRPRRTCLYAFVMS